MSQRICEKYKNLYEACKKYPEIVLTNRPWCKAEIYQEPIPRSKNGFIEKFCINN